MGIAEAAESGIIHYLPQEIASGVQVHMQTLYMSWLTMLIVAVIVFAATRKADIIPSGIQNIVEIFIEWLNGLMEKNLGIEGRRTVAPFIITLFLYIFVGNEMGLLPQVGVHFTSPTNDINVTLGLSIMVSLLVYILGLFKKGPGYLKHFVQPYAVFLPINLLEEIAKPITMALRLFGNILAGEILLIILYQLVPWVVPNVWVGFSLVIGFLQAFIFTMLTMIALAPVFKEGH
jgi:F-type H+-transporting ATPase subunit a